MSTDAVPSVQCERCRDTGTIPGSIPALDRPCACKQRVHYLKTWPQFFDAVVNGHKRFEVRRNDRGFAVGDGVVLREFNPVTQTYSGRESRWLIGYMLTGPQFGIEAGHSVLSLVVRL